MATYDLKYPGAAIDAILDTAYDLQNAGYIFRGLASEYSNTPTERSWVLAGEGETGHGFTSPVPKGYIGVCVFNGTSWTGKLLKCVSIDSTPTNGSTNAVSSGGAYASISQLAATVNEALDNLTFTDSTPSAFLGEYIKEKVSTTAGGIERILTYFTILSATASKAGLLSAADKAKLDAILGNLRSLEIDDTTAYADLGNKIVESLKATIGGTEETISTFQLLAATASKAGLLSAADKAKLDALWSSGYQFAGIATPSTTPISTTSKIFYIATEAGTYFNAVTITQGINILSWNGTEWSAVQVVGIDDEPTAGSSNLIESGAVFSLSAELGNPVKSLSGSHSATSSEGQYIEIPGIKNGKSYIVNASATVSSPTSMCWQIYGYNGSSYTALWGALPTSSKRFDTFSGGVEYTYLKYYLRIVQDVSDSDFVIKDYGNIKDELSRIEGIAQNNKGKIEDVEESLSGVVIETVVGPLEANTQKYIDGIENGKDYRVITQMSVETPTSMSFQIYGYKNGAATALFGATANQEKMLRTYNSDGAYDYDRYFYKISQEMSGGKVVIVSDFWQSGIDAVAADVDGLKKTVYKKTFEVEKDFDAYTYLQVPMEAGKTYRYVSDLDDTHEGEAVTQIYCKINDSWTLKYGFLAKTDRKITIPSDSTGVQIYVRFECSGSILVENVNSIEYRLDEMSDENNIIITANSDTNSSADFTGNTAIQDAIDSITDASPGKVYTIQATGEFIADSISDYQAQRTQYVFIRGKNYINIDGVSKNSCIIRCSLPDTVAENKLVDNNFSASDYALFQPLWWDFNGKIKNVTIIARNIRYPLHVDSSTTTLQENTTIDIENCDLIHEGKYGDAVGSIGGNAVGFAVSQGMTLNLKGCKFEDAYGAPYGHDNVNHKVSGTINYIDCEFIHNAPAFNNAKPSIHFECLSKYGVSSIMNVIRCLIPKGTRYYGYMSNLDTIKRNADSICNIVNVDSYPVPQDSAAVSTIALMIKSNSTSSPSSVRVDPTSTAFDDIFGYSKETAFQMNTRTCRRRQYGYEYKDGGNGLQGIAIGTVNVSQALVDGKYINYLGKRLGDCSETNKTLTVIVDGVSHDIVFDKDYNGTADNVAPNYSNSDIIAEMNTALSGYAVVSTYSIDNDWMPNFLKGVEVRFNKDNVFIEAGMAVVYEGNGVRKAKRTDGRIDGIALDSAAVNDNLRIITGGSIAYQGVRYSIKKASGSHDISTLSYGTKLSISQTDGVFEVSESVPVCMIGEGNAVII